MKYTVAANHVELIGPRDVEANRGALHEVEARSVLEAAAIVLARALCGHQGAELIATREDGSAEMRLEGQEEDMLCASRGIDTPEDDGTPYVVTFSELESLISEWCDVLGVFAGQRLPWPGESAAKAKEQV